MGLCHPDLDLCYQLGHGVATGQADTHSQVLVLLPTPSQNCHSATLSMTDQDENKTTAYSCLDIDKTWTLSKPQNTKTYSSPVSLLITALALVFPPYKKLTEIPNQKLLLFSESTQSSMNLCFLYRPWNHPTEVQILSLDLPNIPIYWNVPWLPMMDVLHCCKLWIQFLQLWVCIWWSLAKRH